jgi:hypothetical protein
MGLMVVSQRPAKVDKNVLSQCNTQIILKVTNPNDLKALASSVEGLTGDSEDEIQRLPVGVAFVSHPRISIPVLVEIRPRETAHGGESVDVMASIRGAERKAQEKEEEDEDEDEEDDAPAHVAPKPAPQRKQPVAREEDEERPLPVAPKAHAPEPHRAPPPAPTTPSRAISRAPQWLEDIAEEVRFVGASSLDDLELRHLEALETELSQKAVALSRSVADYGSAGEETLRKLNALLARLHVRVEERQRAERSLFGRLRRRSGK